MTYPKGITEDEHTVARRLKGCCERRELPTWAEIEFVADALLSRMTPGAYADNPNIDIIDQKSMQIGDVKVTTTFGRIRPTPR